MESNCMDCNENIYFACRKRASIHNDRLCSRESAAELLGISSSTLANYELGITKAIPVDMVVMMSDLYNAPELKSLYCKRDCLIGRMLPIATEIDSLESITVRLLNGLDDGEIAAMKKKLLSIAEDGKISPEEVKELNTILARLNKISESISELRMLAEKCTEKGGSYGAHR